MSPSHVGASDACQLGMGGVWFGKPGADSAAPLLWRHPFPAHIQKQLITVKNPKGALSISDFELTAMIAHKDILAQAFPVAEKTLWVAADNRAALARSNKGSSTSAAARSYLLRFNTLHQRAHRYVAVHDHIAGRANVMADNASRLWNLSDTALLTHFNTSYPQASPWQLYQLPHSTSLALIGALCKQQQPTGCPLSGSMPLPQRGPYGSISVPPCPSTLTRCPRTLSPSCKSSRSVCEVAPLPPAVDPCGLELWKTQSVPWARRTMQAWGPRTLA